jgi:hypothetical protein
MLRGDSLTSKTCQRKFKRSAPGIFQDFPALLRLGIAERIGADWKFEVDQESDLVRTGLRATTATGRRWPLLQTTMTPS